MALPDGDYCLRAFQISSHGQRLDHSRVTTSGWCVMGSATRLHVVLGRLGIPVRAIQAHVIGRLAHSQSFTKFS